MVQWVILHRSRSLSSCNLIISDLVHKDILQGQWQQNNYYFKNGRIFESLQHVIVFLPRPMESQPSSDGTPLLNCPVTNYQCHLTHELR